MSELKRRTYFEENSCLIKPPISQYPVYEFPLEKVNPCVIPCIVPKSMAGNPQPSQLFGDALGMDGGSGSYYNHSANMMYPISRLNIPNHPGPHLNNPSY